MKILFICGGNVARSQMAEAIFNKFSDGKNIAISAGTKVDSTREGQKVKDKDMNIVEIMQEMGIDVSNYTRKQLTPEMFNEADKVIVINPSEKIPEYVKENEKTTFWWVPDPFNNRTLEFAREVRNKIQSMISNFIETSQELKLNTDIKLH